MIGPITNSNSATYFGVDTAFTYLNTYSKSSCELEDCLERKDFKQIIQNSSLFWLAFCKATCLHAKHSSFCVEVKEKIISYYGEESILRQIQGMIEDFRLFFIEAFESKEEIEVLVIKNGGQNYMLKKPVDDVLILNGCNYWSMIFDNYVGLGIENLANLCGASYSLDKKIQHVEYIGGFNKSLECPLIRIKMIEGNN